MKARLLVTAALLSAGFLTGCESSEDDKINQAQACLDKATGAADVGECTAKVEGLLGPRAAIIRCSAAYISQGFTTHSTKFLDAFRALRDQSGSTNSTVAMMTYLSFDGADANAANAAAAEAVMHCTQTGLEGMIMFANMTKLATRLKYLAGIGTGVTPTPAQLEAQVGNLTNQEAGEAAVAIADNYCRNSSTNDEEFCGEFNAAVNNGGTSTEQIGCLIKRQLNPSLPPCP